MTPEERFTRIENFLSTVAEHQSHFAENHRQHNDEIRELREMHKMLVVAHFKGVEERRKAKREFDERSRETEKKLKALIEIVDQIIRDRNDRRD
jgi:hypothetical protein